MNDRVQREIDRQFWLWYSEHMNKEPGVGDAFEAGYRAALAGNAGT